MSKFRRVAVQIQDSTAGTCHKLGTDQSMWQYILDSLDNRDNLDSWGSLGSLGSLGNLGNLGGVGNLGSVGNLDSLAVDVCQMDIFVVSSDTYGLFVCIFGVAFGFSLLDVWWFQQFLLV